jgi:kinesin family member 11
MFLQKRMKETECTLADLETRYMKANDTIKEKQYLVENLLKSGKNLLLPGKAYHNEDFLMSLHMKQ